LERQIHEATKITVSALRGTSPSQFSVEERFSWSENRQTTLSKLDGSRCSSSYILTIDALDECDNDKNFRIILQL